MDPDRQHRLRWHIEIIAPAAPEPNFYQGDFDEIEDMQEFVEAGPEWRSPGYTIVITYNLGLPTSCTP